MSRDRVEKAASPMVKSVWPSSRVTSRQSEGPQTRAEPNFASAPAAGTSMSARIKTVARFIEGCPFHFTPQTAKEVQG